MRPLRPARPWSRPARLVLAVLVAALAAALLSPAPAAQAGPADKKKQVDKKIDQLQGDLEDTSADLVAAYQRLQQVQAKLPGARAALAKAQQRVTDAKAHDQEVGQRLAVATAQEGKAADDLAATLASTSETSDALAGIARSAYQTGGVGELAVVLQAESADDFAERAAAAETAMNVQGQALAQLDVDRAETAAKRARLTAVRQQVAQLKKEAEAAVARAAQAEKDAAAAKASLEALERDRQAQVSHIAARKAAEKKRLDALERQSRKLQAQLRAIARAQLRKHRSSGGSSSSGTSAGGFLSRPVSGGWISSEFGRRFHPILHYWRLHAGMDFAVGCGTPVHAAASGTVVSAGWGGGYGNRIVVSHGVVRGVSLATSYNHLSRIIKHSGHVSRGQLIGYSGTTGSSTGCHLHFETYDNGTPVNPRRWL